MDPSSPSRFEYTEIPNYKCQMYTASIRTTKAYAGGWTTYIKIRSENGKVVKYFIRLN
jgi:hypothetical protein